MTHDDLVHKAAQWCAKKGWPVVVTELRAYTTSGETPDVLAFRPGMSLLVECKASRPDFLADRKKSFRRYPHTGIGTHRAYCAPRGLISEAEIPDGWGLLEVFPDGSVGTTRHPYHHGPGGRYWNLALPSDVRSEVNILVSALRRLGHDGQSSVSVKRYTIETKRTAGLHIHDEEAA
jgi:hypothetical protein